MGGELNLATWPYYEFENAKLCKVHCKNGSNIATAAANSNQSGGSAAAWTLYIVGKQDGG